MKAVVDEALGDVVDGDAAGGFEGAGVENALVRDAAMLILVEDGIVRLEALGDVVGVEDGDLWSPG